MKTTLHPTLLSILVVVLSLAGCAPAAVPGGATAPAAALESATAQPSQTPAPTATATHAPPTPTLTATPLPSPTALPTPTELPVETYIAYVQQDALLVTHVIGGKALETKQIIQAQVSGGIIDIAWSPSGEYLAFNMVESSMMRVFVAKLQGDSPPVDLGNGSDFAWAPDSKLLAYEHEYELWTYAPAGGQTRQLTTHLGTHWWWTKPAFAPAGDALVAAGTDTHGMDRNGNTIYKLYRVPLDGSAAGQYPSSEMPGGITGEIQGRMPLAIRFSPDGQKLAVIASAHIEACAPWAHYQIGEAGGSDLHEFPVASLAGLVGENLNPYFYGDSLVWTADSGGLWVNGLVRDCFIAATVVGGPQISHITLDGVEHEVIAGDYGHLSLDRSGSLLGVVNRQGNPRVQILGLDGHLVIDLGEGDLAALRP